MTITPLIGLEVHVELETKSKMFCGCPANHFGKEPNTQTCPVCLGLPGALPVPNKKAIESCISIGLALNCEVSKISKFDRKNYFYPDLSKGYQISQYDQPFSLGGYLNLDSGKKIGVTRVHQEEDTGKLQHAVIDGKKVSLVDFNRSGVPLVEIVSEPDMNSSEEAKEYLKKVHEIIRALGVSSADMDKGQMRLEPTVNIKIERDGEVFYTPLAEIKNINSFNFVAAAIEYEVKRQLEEWEKTGIVKDKGNKTTRGYDSVKKVTFLQRSKEDAQDYRYFPEPDIPPFVISREYVEEIRSTMAPLPEKIISDLVTMGIDTKTAKTLYSKHDCYSVIANLHQSGAEAITANLDLNKLATLLVNGKIDLKSDILDQYKELTTEGNTNEEELSKIVKEIIASNPGPVAEYKKGKTNVAGFFVGLAMKATKGTASPQTLSTVVNKLLSEC